MFSARLPDTLLPNALSAAVAALREQGVPLIDLTVTNPTTAGIAYPHEALGALADPRAMTYDPAPLGMMSARQAIAAEESRRGAPIAPDRIVLTSSTSEAYSLLFKLLCNPGDGVLVPQPSYPLFELLTRLDGVDAAPYHLDWHGAWSIDRDSLTRRLDDRTRAILIVSPNNPTGSRLRRDDHEWLVELARERNLALISDEVFIDYPIAPRADASTMRGEDRALTFTLGGLSKSAGLPQVKLGWIVASGPDALVSDALERLEVICDTYLSVSTPVQVAAPALLTVGQSVRAQIQQRIRQNYAAIVDAARRYPGIRVLEPEGGWACVLQVPSREDEESLVLSLLQEHHVIVQPGYFFDFHRGTHLVVSLLPEPSRFSTAIARVMEVAG